MPAPRACGLRTLTRRALPFLAVLAAATPVLGQIVESAGPVITRYGAVYPVPSPEFVTPTDLTYKVAFDVRDGAASPDEINVRLDTVARFLNMHAQAGVPPERLEAVVVLHGTAGKDALGHDGYRAMFTQDNPNQALVEALLRAGVRVVLCGQTAAHRGIDRRRLIPGVEVALSAMTAHAVLQGQGYRLNPF